MTKLPATHAFPYTKIANENLKLRFGFVKRKVRKSGGTAILLIEDVKNKR